MQKWLTVAESAVSRVRTCNFITPPSGGFFGTPSKPTSTPLRIFLGGFFYEEKMPEKEVITETQALAASGGFAALCGWLNYLLLIEEGREFSWGGMFLHCAISAVCGLISYEILAYEGFPPGFCGALSGLAGWGGTRVLRLIEIVATKRAGIKKEDLK